MAIRVQYGSIADAMRLAAMEGSNEAQWERKKFEAAQAQAEADRQLRAQQMSMQGQSAAMSHALARDKFGADVKQAERAAAQRKVEFEAQQEAQAQMMALREGEAGRTVEDRSAFMAKFGMTPQMLDAAMAVKKTTERPTSETPAAKDMKAQIANYQAMAKQARAAAIEMADPLSIQMGREKPKAGREAEYAKAYQAYQAATSQALSLQGQLNEVISGGGAPAQRDPAAQAQAQQAATLEQLPLPIQQQVRAGTPLAQINFPDGLTQEQVQQLWTVLQQLGVR